MDIHIYCMYVCAWDIYLYAGKCKYKIYVYVDTYILEGYMHMHAHLVFTLYVKYLQFLIFIQYTKMLHELKNSLQKETYQTMYNSCSKFKFKFNFQFLSKIVLCIQSNWACKSRKPTLEKGSNTLCIETEIWNMPTLFEELMLCSEEVRLLFFFFSPQC